MSSEVLPADEAHQLTKCERIIGDGFTTFLKVGLALGEVRDSRLYRAEFESFEDYCDKKWSLTRTRAYQIMSAALTANEVSKKLDTDLNEAQARAIKPVLDEHGADAAAAVISDAHESGKVTAGAINQAAADRGLVAPRPAKVTTTTRTTEATKIEHDVDLATGEIASPGSAPAVTGEVPPLADSGPAPGVEPEQEPGALDPIAAAKAEAAKSPHNLAHKAIDRFRDANKTVEAAGGIDALLAETRDYAAAQNWVKDLEDSIAITETWLSALRRQHLRSV